MQNVIASEFILKANLPDRPVVGAPSLQPESTGEERSDADAILAQSEVSQFTQLVESLQTAPKPSSTTSITNFKDETAWLKQTGPAQSTLFAPNNSDWLSHVAQPERNVELAQELIGTESRFEPDTNEFGTPLSIPPVENMTKQQELSVAASPAEITIKADIPSRAPLPEIYIQRPIPALRKAQPPDAVPADIVAAVPARLFGVRPVVSKSERAAWGFPENRELMSDTHSNTPEQSVRPHMTQGADAPSTPPTSNVEVGKIAQSNSSEQDILISKPLEHPPVSVTTNPGSRPTDANIPLSRESGAQQTQVRHYHSGRTYVAAAATVTRQAADVVAEPRKPPATQLATKVTEHHYGVVRSGGQQEQGNFQTTAAANPQAELPKNISRSSTTAKPDPVNAVRAIRSELTEAPVQLAETSRTTSPKTTVARMQSPDFQSSNIVASDKRTAPPGDSQVLTSPALAETSGSVVSDKPDPLLLPGVSGSGSFVTAPANPTPPPFASAPDPMVFARLSSQLASVAAQNPDAPIELTLSPEELGRVQMNFAAQDGSLSVTISAERPETLALMRRHIDLLMQDFRELGFSDVNLGFEDQPAQHAMPEQAPGHPPPDQQIENAAASGETPGVMIGLSTSAAGGIDVRL